MAQSGYAQQQTKAFLIYSAENRHFNNHINIFLTITSAGFLLLSPVGQPCKTNSSWFWPKENSAALTSAPFKSGSERWSTPAENPPPPHLPDAKRTVIPSRVSTSVEYKVQRVALSSSLGEAAFTPRSSMTESPDHERPLPPLHTPVTPSVSPASKRDGSKLLQTRSTSKSAPSCTLEQFPRTHRAWTIFWSSAY